MAELVDAQQTANATNKAAMEAAEKASITDPSTSYEYESAGATPGMELPKGASDVMPENAPFYQSEMPAEAIPEAAQAAGAQVETTEVAGQTTADLTEADTAQAGTTTGDVTLAGDSAVAGLTQVDPNAVTIEDSAEVTAQGSEATLAETAATEGVQTNLSPEALAANQLQQITSQNSPLMMAARQRALEQANSRGMLNSSLAAGAAQRSMVEAATPLALQDAATAWKHQELNQTLKHDAIQNDANRSMQVSITNAELKTATDRANVDRELDAGMWNIEQYNKINTSNATIMADFMSQNMTEANRQEAINAELTNQQTQFDADAANRMEEFNAFEANKMAAVNMADANEMARFNADSANRMEQFNADEANRLAEFNASEANRMEAINAELANQTFQFNAREKNAVADANAARYAAMQQNNTAEANKHAQFIMQMETEISKQYLAGEQAMSLADIQGKYQTTISTNAAAASLYEAYFDGIASTLSNTTLDAGAIASRINVQKRFLETGLDLISAISDIAFEPDLPDDFSGDAWPRNYDVSAP